MEMELLTKHEKQLIWRNKQIEIFYGSGRPLFNITKKNQFIRKYYDGEYYMRTLKYKDLDNKNFINEKPIKIID
jgi:hypothetical protein